MKQILKAPVITEKATSLQEKGRYTFLVDKNANKVEIKKAIEKTYGVKVEDVNTFIVAGKSKTKYTKAGVIAGRTATRKKAIVTVAEGEMIDFYGEL